MKSASISRFGDKMKVAVHKVINLIGIKYGENVFEKVQIAPQNDNDFYFSGFLLNDTI